jgi:hypothetical protein
VAQPHPRLPNRFFWNGRVPKLCSYTSLLLGLMSTLKASNKGVNGGVEVASAKGNAAKAGLKSGDFVVYCSSFFGDELWPADQLGFVRSAIQVRSLGLFLPKKERGLLPNH